MTLNKLIRELLELQSAGHGRDKVTVDKDSLWDGNDTFSICEINSASRLWIRIVDGDGAAIILKDGSEKQKRCIVLSGESTK